MQDSTELTTAGTSVQARLDPDVVWEIPPPGQVAEWQVCAQTEERQVGRGQPYDPSRCLGQTQDDYKQRADTNRTGERYDTERVLCRVFQAGTHGQTGESDSGSIKVGLLELQFAW